MSTLESRVSPLKPIAVRVGRYEELEGLLRDSQLTVRALQNDMAQAAIVLRDALFDLHKNDGLTGGLQYRLEKSLTVLDFPHYIPIANSDDALIEEWHRLNAITDDLDLILDDERADELADYCKQWLDVDEELERRGIMPDCGEHQDDDTRPFSEYVEEIAVMGQCPCCGQTLHSTDDYIEVADDFFCSDYCLVSCPNPKKDGE